MKTYLTVVTDHSYLKGALILAESLKNTGSKFPFTICITREIELGYIDLIRRLNINIVILEDDIKIDNKFEKENSKNGYGHWNNTFIKLKIFSLIEFEKIIYLDSDMMVTTNLDHLFECNHMSAVVAGGFIRKDWKDLNSGIMVIVPQPFLDQKIADKITEVSSIKEIFGNQDLIQAFYKEWTKSNLSLDYKYNVFAQDVKAYTARRYNLNFKNVDNNTLCVIHFVGKKKPWNHSFLTVILQCLKLIFRCNYPLLKIYLMYYSYLFEINKLFKNIKLVK